MGRSSACQLKFLERDGPTSLDRFAAKLSYNKFIDVMPPVSYLVDRCPEYEQDNTPHLVFGH